MLTSLTVPLVVRQIAIAVARRHHEPRAERDAVLGRPVGQLGVAYARRSAVDRVGASRRGSERRRRCQLDAVLSAADTALVACRASIGRAIECAVTRRPASSGASACLRS